MKTIIGYHDKKINKIGIIKSKQLPVFVQENYVSFVVTRDHIFSISTQDVRSLIKSFRTIQMFHKVKQKTGAILIVPGILISILYFLKLIGYLQSFPILIQLLSGKFVNVTFWVAVIGIMILWHDHYRFKSHPIKLPEAPEIPQKELDSIEKLGFRFTRYVKLNTLDFLSEEIQKLLYNNYYHNSLNSLALLENLLQYEEIQEILKRANLKLTTEHFAKLLIDSNSIPNYKAPGIRNLLMYTIQEALISESYDTRIEHLFIMFMRTFPVLKHFLDENNASIELLREIVHYHILKEKHLNSVHIFNPDVPYHKTGGIGKHWIYGYTFFLDKFSSDLNVKMDQTKEKYGIGHDTEVEELTAILGKLSKKNVLLLGDPGVGKSSLIKGLAQRINSGDVPQQLHSKRIIQLDIAGLIANSGQSKMELLLKQALNELSTAGNTILYIDEIQTIIPTKSKDSGSSVASILLPYILEGKFPVIGTIDYSDYKRIFYKNNSLRQSFENIEIPELSPKHTLRILETQISAMEQNYNLFITFPAIESAIELSQRYITDRKLPDSAVNTIEGACAWAQTQQLKILTSEHVSKYISIQTEIPVESISSTEATHLMNLEENIKKKVIGQNEAVHKVVEALKRSRVDIRDPNKPIGVFLFLGPTGVGKTYLAKTLAEQYFHDKHKYIQIDMSEYQDVQSITKFLGSYKTDGSSHGQVTLLDRIKSNPHSVVLFDEIEKAHPTVLDLFLQLFDEGHLTSNDGEQVNFTNSIIITTSNIGSRVLLESLNEDNEKDNGKILWQEAKKSALMELKQALRPELLNRYDSIIVFEPHSMKNLIKITELLLNDLAERTHKKGIELTWGKSIPVLIASKAQEPGMGARPLKRFIQEKIEGHIATQLISGETTKGENIEIKGEWLNELKPDISNLS